MLSWSGVELKIIGELQILNRIRKIPRLYRFVSRRIPASYFDQLDAMAYRTMVFGAERGKRYDLCEVSERRSVFMKGFDSPSDRLLSQVSI